MPVEKKTVLRVLYTINSSPQYILARSQSRVQISVIPSSAHESCSDTSNAFSPIYGSVSLKTCLDTVFRSSPELAHDNGRDFSLYVLDPLESRSAPAPVHINASEDASSANGSALGVEQTRGVAVGLGLMSWALSADESDMMPVVGTLVKQTNGQEALEVVFSLREVRANSILPNYCEPRCRDRLWRCPGRSGVCRHPHYHPAPRTARVLRLRAHRVAQNRNTIHGTPTRYGVWHVDHTFHVDHLLFLRRWPHLLQFNHHPST